jgi:predicted nucleic acid-binding protein
MALVRRYWDANAFLGLLNGEQAKLTACQSVLDAAEQGRIVIVTSALTIAEVLHIKNEKPVPKDKRDLIKAFFKVPYISIQNVTRGIAERAQEVYWEFGVQPKDAIHVATALVYKLGVIETFDGKLLGLDGKIGQPPIIIRIPHEPGQQKLGI